MHTEEWFHVKCIMSCVNGLAILHTLAQEGKHIFQQLVETDEYQQNWCKIYQKNRAHKKPNLPQTLNQQRMPTYIYLLQQTIIHYHGDGPPPTEAMFHPHQNGHPLHDRHQERKHVLKSVLAHQKDSHPHGSPWNIIKERTLCTAPGTAFAGQI